MEGQNKRTRKNRLNSKNGQNRAWNLWALSIRKNDKKTFPKGKRVIELLDVMHSDIWEPQEVKTRKGSEYFVTFIDDYSDLDMCIWLLIKVKQYQFLTNTK